MPNIRPWSLILAVGLFLLSCSDDVTAPPTPDPVVDMIRINEFMASNDEGLVDEDGDDEDWFELFNAGSAAVDLTGWHLTDDAADRMQWTLPALTLDPGAYVTIFASDKNRAIAGAELHTNFKLSSGGEYFGLSRPDGTTVVDEYAPSYPAQQTNQSYGYLPTGDRGFLRSATPGAENSIEAIEGLTVMPESGVFTEPVMVTLSFGGTGSVDIHYTTDNSEPTQASPLFSGPIEITATSRLRARGFDGSAMGPEVQAFYTEISDSVAAFRSDLPIVVVHTLGVNIPNNDDGIEGLMTVVPTTGGAAQTTDAPNYSGGSSFRIRGNTSASFNKKQYKLELHDATGNDIDSDLLGMGLEEDWILYAPGRFDRSMIANPLMQRLAGRVGLTQLSSRFVEVFLNKDDLGPVTAEDYVGLYTLGENIKIDPLRVDITELNESDNAEPEITGGYILQIDRVDTDEHSFRTTSGFPAFEDNTLVVKRPKLDDITTEQMAWIEGYFNDFEAALSGPNSTDPVLGYAPFIDIPSWIDAHILRLMSKDVDMLVFSHHMVLDRGGKLRTDPLWDFDRSFNSPDARNLDPGETHHPTRVDPFGWGWWGDLFADPAYLAQYEARWAELRGGILSEAALFADIDELAAQIAGAYPREEDEWGSTSGYGSRFGDLDGEIDALKTWLAARLTFLDGVLDPTS